MIKRDRLKRVLAQVLAVLAAVSVLAALAVIGRVAVYTLSGANTAQALHEVPELPLAAEYQAEWLPDRWKRDRRMEPGTRRKVQAAYVAAWEAIGRYQETGNRENIVLWFAGPARQQALASHPTMRRQTWGMHFRLALTFYALDGATVGLRDEGATVVRLGGDPASPTVVTTRETYDVVLTLEDGYWRIRQFRLLSTQDAQVVGVAAGTGAVGGSRSWPPTLAQGIPAPAPPRTSPTGPAVRMPIIWLPPAPDVIGAPVSFDPVQVAADLDAARRVGARLVQVTAPTEGLGEYPAAARFRPLGEVLDLAHARGLGVEVVVDPAGTERGPRTWIEGDRRIHSLTLALAGHPALKLWNLQESPDGAPTDPAAARAWLLRAVAAIRAADPVRPVTIGWATPQGAVDPALAAQVDLVSLPWQGPADRLPAWLAQVRRTTGDRPVRVTLTEDSHNGWLPGGRTPAGQAARTLAALRAAAGAGAAGALVGVVRDGAVPGPQADQGLVRADGSVKPVAATLDPDRWSTIRSPGPLEHARKRFPWLAAVLILIALPDRRARLRRWLSPMLRILWGLLAPLRLRPRRVRALVGLIRTRR